MITCPAFNSIDLTKTWQQFDKTRPRCDGGLGAGNLDEYSGPSRCRNLIHLFKTKSLYCLLMNLVHFVALMVGTPWRPGFEAE